VVPGEYRTDTSSALITVADLSSVWVVSDVPESEIRLITRGERVQIELAAYPGEVFHGRLCCIADVLDPQTRTVKVHVEMDNRAGRLRPEMFGRIRHSHGMRTLPLVPAGAVLQRGGTPVVAVERVHGNFEFVPIQSGESHAGRIPVLAGLSAGQRVVVDGAILLRNW
jgi:cobalt-zinc-cadmium efflux system membrane fusion protein